MTRLSWLIVLLGVSCGSNGVDIHLDGTDPCADFATALCAVRSSCTKGANLTQDFGDLATCMSREQAACNESTSAPDSTKAPAGVEACAKAYLGYSCSAFFDGTSPSACRFTGTRASGAACAFSDQCSTGFCTGQRDALCGVCADPPSPGASCQSSGCGNGLECEAPDTTCVVVGTAGAACDNDTQPCGFGLDCASGACIAQNGSSGASCSGSSAKHCKASDGVTCQGSSGSRTCRPTTFVGDGQPCGQTANGYVACASGGRCYTAGTVALAGVQGTCKTAAADGATCDLVAGPPCLTPARCVVAGSDGGTSGVCTLPSATICP